jgi:predicted methyltransferase
MRRFNKSASSKSAKPDDVLGVLDLKPGMNVLEIGVGGGYFISRIAERIGRSGLVYGVDTEPAFIQNLHELNKQTPYQNIKPILFRNIDDVLSIETPIDAVFTRNAYHHMRNRTEYFKGILPILKPGCMIAIIDYNEYPFSLLRILGHFTRKEEIIREQKDAGNDLSDDVRMFKKQSFLIFRKA